MYSSMISCEEKRKKKKEKEENKIPLKDPSFNHRPPQTIVERKENPSSRERWMVMEIGRQKGGGAREGWQR